MSILIISNYKFFGVKITNRLSDYGFNIINIDTYSNREFVDNESIFNFQKIFNIEQLILEFKVTHIINAAYIDNIYKVDYANNFEIFTKETEKIFTILNVLNNLKSESENDVLYYLLLNNSIFGDQKKCNQYYYLNPQSCYSVFLTNLYHIHNVFKINQNLSINFIIHGNIYGYFQNLKNNILPWIVYNAINEKTIQISNGSNLLKNWINIEYLIEKLTGIINKNTYENSISIISGDNLTTIDFINLVCNSCDKILQENGLVRFESRDLIKFISSNEKSNEYSIKLKNEQQCNLSSKKYDIYSAIDSIVSDYYFYFLNIN